MPPTYLVAQIHNPATVLIFGNKVVIVHRDGTVTEVARRPEPEAAEAA